MNHIFSIYGIIHIPLILSLFIPTKKYQIYAIWFWIFVLTLFRGLRWEIGTDWDWYELSFYNIQWSDFFCYELNKLDSGENKVLEQGWAFLLILCRTLFRHYTFFLLLTNFAILYISYKVAVKTSNHPIVFFVMFLVSQSFFPVRQHLAVAIVTYSFVALYQRGRIGYIIGLVCAFLMHQSSLIMAPFLLRKNIKITFIQCFCVLFLCLIIGNFFIRPLLPYIVILSYYVSGQIGDVMLGYIDNGPDAENMYSAKASVFVSFSFYMFFLYFYYYFLKNRLVIVYFKTKLRYGFINSLIFLYVLYLVVNYLFSNSVPVFSRFMSYFLFSMPILTAMSLDNLKKEYRIYALMIIAAFCFYKLLANLNNPWPELFYPYKTVFE